MMVNITNETIQSAGVKVNSTADGNGVVSTSSLISHF
jgi:hypothetical protein